MIFSALCPGWRQTTLCSDWRGSHVEVCHTSPDRWESRDQRPSVLLWGNSPPQPISFWVSVAPLPSWIKMELVPSSSLTPLLPENNWPATTIWRFEGNKNFETLVHPLDHLNFLFLKFPIAFDFFYDPNKLFLFLHNCCPFPSSEWDFNYRWYECGVQWTFVKIAVCDSLIFCTSPALFFGCKEVQNLFANAIM